MFRKRGRTSIQCAIQLSHEQIGKFEAVTRDVSASGMFIDLDSIGSEGFKCELHPGDKLEAKVDGLYDKFEMVELTVIRCAKDGFGLTFQSV